MNHRIGCTPRAFLLKTGTQVLRMESIPRSPELLIDVLADQAGWNRDKLTSINALPLQEQAIQNYSIDAPEKIDRQILARGRRA